MIPKLSSLQNHFIFSRTQRREGPFLRPTCPHAPPGRAGLEAGPVGAMRPYGALGRRTSTLVAESLQSLCSKTARQSCKASGGLASGDTWHPLWAACGRGRGHGCQEAGLGAVWGASSHSSSDCGLLHDASRLQEMTPTASMTSCPVLSHK